MSGVADAHSVVVRGSEAALIELQRVVDDEAVQSGDRLTMLTHGEQDGSLLRDPCRSELSMELPEAGRRKASRLAASRPTGLVQAFEVVKDGLRLIGALRPLDLVRRDATQAPSDRGARALRAQQIHEICGLRRKLEHLRRAYFHGEPWISLDERIGVVGVEAIETQFVPASKPADVIQHGTCYLLTIRPRSTQTVVLDKYSFINWFTGSTEV
jgi:hypothetical protein